MTIKEIKHQLAGYRAICDTIERLEEDIARIRARMEDAKKAHLDGIRVQQTGKRDPLGDFIVLLDEKQKKLNREMMIERDIKAVIDHMLEGLGYQDKQLMSLYYVDGLRWSDVADEMDLSFSSVTHKHSEILKKLAGL